MRIVRITIVTFLIHKGNFMTKITRRRFLEDSLIASFATSAATVALPDALVQQAFAGRAADANDQIGMAIIGIGGRSSGHLNYFTKDKRTKILYLCDPDLKRAQQQCKAIEEKFGYRPKAVADLSVRPLKTNRSMPFPAPRPIIGMP